ncbi:unnamed protein product [Larinioides sclopetarius]|uniref:Uncharacterized protein n=1 Tax=Larinioides sclopetarius TaxID=280406 RepID=A0AAV2BBH3_9ARAC
MMDAPEGKSDDSSTSPDICIVLHRSSEAVLRDAPFEAETPEYFDIPNSPGLSGLRNGRNLYNTVLLPGADIPGYLLLF